MSIDELAQVIYETEFSSSLRESIYAFPIVEGLHLIGLALSVGLLIFVDLRLLGWWFKKIPIPDILHLLRPWLLVGFVITFITGILLFIATSATVLQLNVFYYKLVFILLAGLNALFFEIKWGRSVDQWGDQIILPLPVKLAGFASLFLWALVIITGRLIPYLSYK